MAQVAVPARDAVLTGPKTNYQRIREALRHDIMAGHFSGDERLVMAVLCERYGISTPPIREALNQLEVEGLVIIEANRGARVRAITREFIAEIFEIRVTLETRMVELSVPHVTPADVSKLEAAEAEFEAAIGRGSIPAMAIANRLFHHTIYGVRPNNEAMRLLRQHSAVITTVRNRVGFGEGRTDRLIEDHRQIIRACADRDTTLATALTRSHIEHSAAELLERMG